MHGRPVAVALALIAFAVPAAALVSSPPTSPAPVLKGSFASAKQALRVQHRLQTAQCTLAPLRGGAAGASASLSADFVLKTLAPLMGGLISVSMFMAPLPSVLNASKNKSLGELNLSPYPAQCGNCAAWLSYSIILKNPWIFVPNVVGLILGLFFTYIGSRLGDAAQKAALLRSFGSYMSVIALAILCAAKGVFNVAANEVIGRVGIALLMIYYCSPLSTIAKVVETKDSSSIDPALTIVGIANGCFWGMYGLAISDIYVYGPNLVGASIALFTTLTWLFFRK